ncbi:MAG: fluoride efflux transporter CrcB, partial [Hyphococcus sp.]
MSLGVWTAVAAGGAIGAVMRFGVSRVSFLVLGPNFPWGTLAANVVGSFAMGLVIVWLSGAEQNSPVLRAFLSVGLLGAFTTFSTFSLDAVTLYRDRTVYIAAAYVAASLFLSIAGL